MGISLARLNRRENGRSLVVFDRKEIAHLGALKLVRFSGEQSKSSPQTQGLARFWCTQVMIITTAITAQTTKAIIMVASLSCTLWDKQAEGKLLSRTANTITTAKAIITAKTTMKGALLLILT